MKHKKLFRSVTALLAALVLMGGFSVTAFAGGGDVSDEPPTPVTETEPEETEEILEQTGQLNWPIPLMGLLGTCLLAVGGILCFRGKRDDDET